MMKGGELMGCCGGKKTDTKKDTTKKK